MSITKLCAIGNLDIEFNLVLRSSEAECFKFEINTINSPLDLKNLFYPEVDENNEERNIINYFDYVTLSSKNDFINTLLFINRAFKNKTFVELILLNQMHFSQETSFLKDLIKQICSKNYFFIIENKVYDIPSKIKFNIKILEDDNDNIISNKSFELFEKNVEKEENEIDNSNLNLFNRISYNFGNTQFFLTNFLNIIKYKEKDYTEISTFYKYLIKSSPSMKIITIYNEDSLFTSNEEFIDIYKEIIEYSDYIFTDKKILNEFYTIYNEIYETNINCTDKKEDLILKDSDKKRKGIERTTILMGNLDYFHIYIQKGFKMELISDDYFDGKIIWKSKNIENENRIKDIINSHLDLFKGIFIGGFLSRLINGKTIKTCVTAGCFSVRNMIEIVNNNIDYVTDIDLFNVIVPIKKKTKIQKMQKQIKINNLNLQKREKGFILDCINENSSRKKEYNPLKDMYCQSFLYNPNNIKHLTKLGFVNKKLKVLKDPDSIPKKFKKINNPFNNLFSIETINLNLKHKKKINFHDTFFPRTTRNKWVESIISNDMKKTNYTGKKSSESKTNVKKKNKNSTLPMMKTSYHFRNNSNINLNDNELKNNGTLSDRRLNSRNRKNNLNCIETNYIDKSYYKKFLKKIENKIS